MSRRRKGFQRLPSRPLRASVPAENKMERGTWPPLHPLSLFAVCYRAITILVCDDSLPCLMLTKYIPDGAVRPPSSLPFQRTS